MSHLDYWADRRGEDYQLQQAGRAAHADQSYALQEAWLTDFVDRFARTRSTGPLRVLDYGCGFGRFAHALSRSEAVDYFGFDISASMTEPLRANPPPRIKDDLDRRLRVGGQFEAAFPEQEKFDLIFTVSVLIHNPPQMARSMIDSMLARLTPGGRIVLIENALTAVSMLENLWHGGCWCHAFPRYLEGRADVAIIDKVIDRHGIYIIDPTSDNRPSRFEYRSSADGAAATSDLAGILVKGLDQAESNAGHMLGEWTEFLKDGGDLLGRVHDLEESRATQARQEAELREALARADEALAACRTRFAERQQILEEVARAADRAKQWEARQRPQGGSEPEHPSSGLEIEWNALRDTRYSREVAGLEDILHVFHKEWFGIRAAVGSLPGDKAAITSTMLMPTGQIDELYNRILSKNYRRIIFHGHSRSTSAAIDFLASRGLSEHVYLVQHGNPAQWHHKAERDAMFDAIALVKAGRAKRIHIMRAGFEFPSLNAFRPLLLNLAPKMEPRRLELDLELDPDQAVVFAPGWADWRKNLYASVIAASMSDKVKRIWLYARDFSAPEDIMSKIDIHPYISREQTFDLISMSSICMNASLLDCHPMVNLEAQALGRACIRGPLNLDALDDHPYVRLTSVADVASIAEIKATVDKVLSAPAAELRALVNDYQEQSDAVARSRYLEFLEI